MTPDWYEHPDAREEFLNAHDRYSGIDDGQFGDEFADAAESAAELILRWPDAPPPYRGRRREPMIRAWHLGKFPYRLVYTVRERTSTSSPTPTRRVGLATGRIA